MPIAIEWPHDLIATISESRRISHEGKDLPLLDCELRLVSNEASGPIRFEVVSSEWSIEYEFEFRDDEPPLIKPTDADGRIETSKSSGSLAAFLTLQGLLVTFENEIVLVEQGFLLRPDREARLLPVDSIEVFDWSGVNIRRESQGPERDPSTVQLSLIHISEPTRPY